MDDFISSLDTEAILGNASPLKPRVDIFRRSSTEDNLLVACLEKASLKSSFDIPQPLSIM